MKKGHDGDCTIYACIEGNPPFPYYGICTCGYGLEKLRENGDDLELMSEELKIKLKDLESKLKNGK